MLLQRNQAHSICTEMHYLHVNLIQGHGSNGVRSLPFSLFSSWMRRTNINIFFAMFNRRGRLARFSPDAALSLGFSSTTTTGSTRDKFSRIDSLNNSDFLDLDEQDELISLYNDINYEKTKNYIKLLLVISLVEAPFFSKLRVYGVYSLNSLLIILMSMINLRYLNYYSLNELKIKTRKELEPDEINFFIKFINLFNHNDWYQVVYNSVQIILTVLNIRKFIIAENKFTNYFSFFLLLPVVNSILCLLIKSWTSDVSNDIKNLQKLKYNKKNV
ncbi:uncharacterized protein ASCRUDRAFT_148068 [Ascoidea rubescens DSM 1968]|uniref:Uncharacterized protein n=1 Tax=Ascoidea rubescens DSM 1968 TaxID=1344418 RepID=A0A1D2VHY5_9ASCO|nr:hypothetical protein ASCRUDRAFT_148068 [Ascoidea rubescens DSM 1968]ODV61271.1 hypothetical protein ASCRUDRAFT_148068 [Ascoidea rubescens DSM 1968]